MAKEKATTDPSETSIPLCNSKLRHVPEDILIVAFVRTSNLIKVLGSILRYHTGYPEKL
jgi:hypothetical protein